MQVILLERVEKLGQMGDEVRVKDGFARNFLLPKKKALRATKANREYFQTQKAQLEAHNLERKKEAEAIAKKLDGKTFVLIRQAGDRGQLYGSVSPARHRRRRSTRAASPSDRTQVPLDQAIKTIGLFTIAVRAASRSARERHDQRRAQRGRSRAPGARRKRAGRDAPKQEEAEVAAEELFEEGAGPKPRRKTPTKAERSRSVRTRKAGHGAGHFCLS